MAELRRAEELRGLAERILAGERDRLRSLGVPGELVLVGGSSVAGALTRGDVDLHLRVDPAAFGPAVAVLGTVHEVTRPEIWAPTLATFSVEAPLPTGLAVTPRGSVHDVRFTRTWRLLRADPDLLAEYNAVKLAGTGAGYEDRKSAFFDSLLDRWPHHPAGGAI